MPGKRPPLTADELAEMEAKQAAREQEVEHTLRARLRRCMEGVDDPFSDEGEQIVYDRFLESYGLPTSSLAVEMFEWWHVRADRQAGLLRERDVQDQRAFARQPRPNRDGKSRPSINLS